MGGCVRAGVACGLVGGVVACERGRIRGGVLAAAAASARRKKKTRRAPVLSLFITIIWKRGWLRRLTRKSEPSMFLRCCWTGWRRGAGKRERDRA